VNSEVTAWVSGRTFSLCTFFLLAGSLFAHSFLKNGRRPAPALYWLASAAALLSHESGALLTPLVALIAVPSPGKPFHRRLFFLLAAVSGGNALVYLWLRHIAGAAIPAASLRLLWEGLIHAGQAIGTYASWMIAPATQYRPFSGTDGDPVAGGCVAGPRRVRRTGRLWCNCIPPATPASACYGCYWHLFRSLVLCRFAGE